jgi:hypothetical protein
MQDVDAGTIVPSTRDLLRVLDTKRRNLALVGLLDGAGAGPAEEAARLTELNVSAFAVIEPGPALALAARGTKTVPSIVLGAAAGREALLATRQHGGDGACIDARLPLAEWDRLAQVARSMRMAPLALASDAAGFEAALKTGAKGIVIAAASAAAVIELAAMGPRSVILVGFVEGADADAVRALAGKVNAAVVPPSVHMARDFADLVAEVDP